MADDNAWRTVALACMGALGTVAGALGWVVKEWRRDSKENAAQALARADAERDRTEKSAEADRAAQTRMADSLGDLAEAVRDGQRDTSAVLARVVGSQNRVTEAVGRWRDSLVVRPRSSESTQALEAIDDEPPPRPAATRSETGRRR